MKDKTIVIKGKLYYANTYCNCGCGSRIPVPESKSGQRKHRLYGIADYIKGHGGHKFGNGNTAALGMKHTAKWKRIRSKEMSDSNHPNYNGGKKLVQARKNNVKRNFSSEFLNTPNNVANEQHHLLFTDKEWVVWIPESFHNACYHGRYASEEQKQIADAIALTYLEAELNYKLEKYARETDKVGPKC